MAVVTPRQQGAGHQESNEDEERNDVAGAVSFFLLGLWSNHAPRLVPFADQREKYRLADPGGSLHSQCTVGLGPHTCPRPASVAHSQRSPLRLGRLQLERIQFRRYAKGTPVRGDGL